MANEVQMSFGLDTKQAEQDLRDFENKTKHRGESAGKKFADAFASKAKAGFTKLSTSVFGQVTAANLARDAFIKLRQSISEGVNSSRDFERALAEVNTILPENAKLTNEAKTAFKDLSTTFATTSASQAKAFYQTISSGVTDTTVALGLVRDANTLAVGGLSELGDSIDILTSIMNVYKDSNITTTEAIDSLFKTVKLAKTTVPELAASLGQVLPIAKTMGINLDTVNAAFAVLSVQGGSTSENMTQLKSLFNAVAKKGHVLGDELNITALKTKKLVQWIRDLEKKTGGSADALFKLLGRTEAVQAALRLMGSGTERLVQNLDEFVDKADEASKAASGMMGTSDFQLRKANAAWELFKQNLGDGIVNFISPATIAFNRLVAAVSAETKLDKLTVQASQLKEVIGGMQAKTEKGIILDAKSKVRLANLLERLKEVESKINDINTEELAVKITTNPLIGAQNELQRLKKMQHEFQKDLEGSAIVFGMTYQQLGQKIIKQEALIKKLDVAWNKNKITASGNLKEQASLLERLNTLTSQTGTKSIQQIGLQEKAKKDIINKALKARTINVADANKRILDIERKAFEQEKQLAVSRVPLWKNEGEKMKLIALDVALAQESAALKLKQALVAADKSTHGIVGSMSFTWSKGASTMIKTAAALENAFRTAIVDGVANSLVMMVENLKEGGLTLADWAGAMASLVGDVMIQLGKTTMAAGLTIDALKGLEGMQAFVAGAALVVAGQLLKNMGKGSTSSSSGGGGGGFAGASNFGQDRAIASTGGGDPTERTNVIVNVEGNILNTQDSTDHILDGLNEAFQKRGAILVDTRFA